MSGPDPGSGTWPGDGRPRGEPRRPGATGADRALADGLVPGAAVTADVVILTIREGRLAVLLVQRGEEPFRGRWALPGGFVGPSEDLEEAAWRVLARETGLRPKVAHLEQLRTYGAPGRDPRTRVVSVAHLGLVADLPAPVGGRGTTSARFWAVEDLEAEVAPWLAFDHEAILADGVERARAKLEYTPLATTFVPPTFTLSELRHVYEAVWGTPVHAANFRRKVLSIEGFVLPVGRTASPGPEGARQPDLYQAGPARLLHPALLRPRPEQARVMGEPETGEL